MNEVHTIQKVCKRHPPPEDVFYIVKKVGVGSYNDQSIQSVRIVCICKRHPPEEEVFYIVKKVGVRSYNDQSIQLFLY